jgi:hypothetical protein
MARHHWTAHFRRDGVWSKISNALKRPGFRSRNFPAQLLSETSRACTIRVRRSSSGRLWNDLGSHACLHHRNRRPGTSIEERISGRREPHPESPNQRHHVTVTVTAEPVAKRHLRQLCVIQLKRQSKPVAFKPAQSAYLNQNWPVVALLQGVDTGSIRTGNLSGKSLV